MKILLLAAEWHLAWGRAKPAVEYLLRAQAWDRALEAILSNAADIVAHGDLLTVVRWMLRVPEPVRTDRISEELVVGVLQSVDEGSVSAETRRRGLVRAGGQVPPRLAFIADAYLASVLTALERGEPALPGAADRTLREVVLLTEQESDAAPAPLIRDRLLAVHGRTLRLAGASAQAFESLSEVGTVAPTVLFKRVGALLMLGDTVRARVIVDAWDELVPVAEPLSIVQGRILRAWLAASDSAEAEATRHLAEAVKVAEIYGLVEVFVRAGPIILERLAAISGPQAAFSEIILARAKRSSSRHPEADLPDPLTERELEILKYLPTRFSNMELAKRCFVSVNTIKTHMAHIYRKLDVTTRDSAIERARLLGIL